MSFFNKDHKLCLLLSPLRTTKIEPASQKEEKRNKKYQGVGVHEWLGVHDL